MRPSTVALGHAAHVVVDGPEGPSTPIGESTWTPWTPGEVARRLAAVDVPWCVTAGWAVDLFVGRETRAHEDLEIAIPAASWPVVRRELPALDFTVAGGGQLWPVTSTNLDAHYQTWGRDDCGVFRLDVFRDPHDGDTWICRLDERLTRPYAALIRRSTDGIPFMAPDVVLLFKAKHDRPKDRADLRVCLPLLSLAESEWLASAIERIYPDHPWLATFF